jgi:hypothetical protein
VPPVPVVTTPPVPPPSPPGPIPRVDKAAPPPKAPAPPATAAPTKADWKQFDPQRRPDWLKPPAAAEGRLELVAVVRGARPLAVFRLDGAYRRVPVGEEIAGLRLIGLETDAVRLRHGEQLYWLRLATDRKLGGSRQPAPARRPTPGPAPGEPAAVNGPAVPDDLPPVTGPERDRPRPPMGPAN